MSHLIKSFTPSGLSFRAVALLCMLLVCSPAARAQDYFGRMTTEGVSMIAAIKYGMISVLDQIYAEEGFYELPYENEYQPDLSAPLRKAYVAGGACCYDSVVYACEYYDMDRIDTQRPMWRRYDASNFNLLAEYELPDNCQCTTTGLTYDPTEHVIYGFNVTYSETYLVRINPENGEMERIGDFLDRDCKYLALACRKDGTLFCIYMNKWDSTHYLARIRKTDARIATIGVLSCGGFMGDDPFVDGGYLQDMWFSNADDRLYWLHQSSTSYLSSEDYTPIMEIDPSACTATMVAYWPQHFLIGGCFFVEPEWSAPSVITHFDFIPATSDRLSGHIVCTVPTTDYIGRPLSGKVHVRATKTNGQALIDCDAEPGETVQSDDMTFALGSIRLKVTVSSDAGIGPTVERTFYAGFDQPVAPSNIRLTAEGLITTLTWETPTEGVNGQPIAPENFTYTVQRYPGPVTVATGLKECVFVEEHPAELTRYVYAVHAVDGAGRDGKTGLSNNLIVGEPLDVPYGGMFTEAVDLFNFYTILDANADNCTWTFENDTQSALYTYSSTSDADDWLISPPIRFEAGKEYALTFNCQSSLADYPEAVDVHWAAGNSGNAHTAADWAAATRLLHLAEVPAEDTAYPEPSHTVLLPAVETSGTYHYAFHCVSPAFSEYLYLYNIRVLEKSELDAIHAPTADAPHATVLYDLAGRRIAKPAAGICIANRKKILRHAQ